MRKNWTKHEEKLLRENYPIKTNNELSEELSRTTLSVYKKARYMGLKKEKATTFRARSEAKAGERGANWKGGIRRTASGYLQIKKKNHPYADGEGYVMKHRLVFEQNTGRYLKPGEVVHHRNGNTLDNRFENLELMTHGEHTALHHTGMRRGRETREKIRDKAIKRLADPRNHPFYKEICPKKLIDMRSKNMLVDEICKEVGISRKTYYNKLRGAEAK